MHTRSASGAGSIAQRRPAALKKGRMPNASRSDARSNEEQRDRHEDRVRRVTRPDLRPRPRRRRAAGAVAAPAADHQPDEEWSGEAFERRLNLALEEQGLGNAELAR